MLRFYFKTSKHSIFGIAASFILTLSLSSCGGGAAAGLGTSSSSCFTALPPSLQTAGVTARLLGVRLLDSTRAKRFSNNFYSKGSKKICVFAFELPNRNGRYQTKKSNGRVVGNFIIVFYSLDKSFIITKKHSTSLPLDFAHSFSIIS